MKKITLLFSLFIGLATASAQTALKFDSSAGPQQQVSVPAVVCPNEFTFEAWINYDGQTEEYITLLEFGNDTPYFGLEGQKLTLYGAVIDDNNMVTNQWMHIATSYSKTTQIAKLYVNGVLVKTATDKDIDIAGTGFGIGYNAGDTPFKGTIDEVRIWNVVRTDAEVASDMNACLAGNESGLYAYYTFNEGTGTAVNDLTANNFDGTLLNMDSATDWVASSFCATLSLDENKLKDDVLVVYPNPASETLKIVTKKPLSTYSIYNVLGSEVQKGTLLDNSINIQKLDNGLYFLKVASQNSIRFIKN